MKRSGRFLRDIMVLTLSSSVMRAVSVLFSSWLKGEIGTAGVGLYQLIMSVYVFGVTIASSGIRLAATRLTVEAEGKERSVMARCLLYSAFFGVAAGALLFFSADFAAVSLLGDTRTKKSLTVLAFGLPFLAMSSAFNGFLAGKRRSSLSAAVQLCEQAVKIALSVALLKKLLHRGVEYACVALVMGSLISEMVSAALYFLIYLGTVRGMKRKGGRGLMKRLLSIALPDAVSSYLRSALNTATQLMVPAGLKKWGGSKELALSHYGMIGGMAINVIFFPSALLDAAGRLLIPELAEDRAKNRPFSRDRLINRGMRYVCYFSFFIAGALWAWGGRLGVLIYRSEEVGRYISSLAPLGAMCYIDGAVDGMLKGLGQQNASMRINIIDSAVTLALTVLLLPLWGVSGYIIILYATEIMNLALSLLRLKRVSGLKYAPFSNILRPMFCAMGAVTLWARLPLSPVIGVLCAGVCYFGLMLFFGGIKKDELYWLGSSFSDGKAHSANLRAASKPE